MASNSILLVAAIDFGTTYSGWAFSFKNEYKTDPTKTSTKHWFGGHFISLKAPTTALIKPDGKTLDSFGYEAETKYANLACSDEYKAWYYFRHFKMLLHVRKAGINEENFRIALEPEAASIFCRLLPLERMVEGRGLSSFKTGSKYMVLDAGGGTVDISVHEVMPGEKLKEIHKPSGGPWGGIQVDEAFKQFIISLVGDTVFCRFQTESKEDYLNLFRDFEIKKRNISPESNNNVTFYIPFTLKEIFQKESGEDISNAIKQTRYVDQVFMLDDKLRVSATVMKNLFSAAIQSTVSHVKELMKDSKVQEISSILMVGGFSESKMFQDAIKSNFRNVAVIIPREAGLVVLNGAVVFGHSPLSIAERVCKYTYGVSTTTQFDETIHDVSKRVEYDDGPRCKDMFSKHIEIGQTVAVEDTTEQKSYFPLREDQTNVKFVIYSSTEKSPMYVTDEGCVKLGSVNVDILDMSVPRKQRTVLVSMRCGGTEIEVTAKEKRTGQTARVKLNFLG
ncbi:hypothetical protein ACJMK2_027161 [Sinanodonta woodiana]|uniref:Uncharacterized protein n=1 Tax=Sinanodonta woodiana TaxID=1069815 RepID=A0ABD3XQ78_SINWO